MKLKSLDIDDGERYAIYFLRNRKDPMNLDDVKDFDLCEGRGLEASYAEDHTAEAYSKSIDFDLKPKKQTCNNVKNRHRISVKKLFGFV